MKKEVQEIVGYEEKYDLMVKCPNEKCQEGVYLGSNYCQRCGVGLRYDGIGKKLGKYLGVGEYKHD